LLSACLEASCFEVSGKQQREEERKRKREVE